MASLESICNATQEAKSDGANMLPLDRLEPLLERLVRIREAIR